MGERTLKLRSYAAPWPVVATARFDCASFPRANGASIQTMPSTLAKKLGSATRGAPALGRQERPVKERALMPASLSRDPE